MSSSATFTAFAGLRMLASGALADVAAAVAASPESTLTFDDATGSLVELDLRRGPEQAVAEYLARMEPPEAPPPPRGRGRPRLGVVAREVTLLPRHWDWLASQPGGASAALRRLVEEARRAGGAGPDRERQAQEAIYRVMTALGGDLPGYEEATRALFAGDAGRLEALVSAWPPDLAAYLSRLTAALPKRETA